MTPIKELTRPRREQSLARRLPRLVVTAVALLAVGGVPSIAVASPPAGLAASCVSEVEPNDQPDAVPPVSGSACLAGSLPDGDAQDTWLWVLGNDDARQRWTVAFDGIAGTASGVELFPVTSAPGVTPIAWVGTPLLVVKTDPEVATASAANQIIPAGEYVLGVGRTGSVAGGALTSFDYRIELTPGDPLPQSADVEPNDDAAHAAPTHGSAFEVSGDLNGSADYLVWKLDEDAASHRWDVIFQGGLGLAEQVQVLTRDGQFVTSAGIDAGGFAHIYDLQLAAGTYLFALGGPPGTAPEPYILSTLVSDVSGSDPEPNDDPTQAVPATLGTQITGRLARTGDIDQFALSIEAQQAQYLLDVRLIWRQGPDRTVCVSGVDENGGLVQLQCSNLVPSTVTSAASGGSAVVRGLYLRPGKYVLTITGEADPDSIYALRVDPTSRPAADFETEPNDTPLTAVTMTPAVVMRGRAINGDRDVYRVVVTGSPQVWTVQLAGGQLDALLWIDPTGQTLAVGEVSDDRTTASIDDAYLPEGEYFFQVTSDGGDYTLSLAPQGPPGSNAELEPDNDSIHAMVLGLDQPMLGRLAQSTDIDVFRFSLTAADHVRIQVEPPADGAINPTLQTSNGNILAFQAAEPAGTVWDEDLQLQPGDYELWLRPAVMSKQSYQVLVSREDPYAVRQDQEPNDSAAAARPVPPSLTITGTRDATGDQDWYRIEPLAEAATITAMVRGDVSSLGVTDGTTELPVTQAAEGNALTFTIGPAPAGVPLYLHLAPNGDYDVALSGIPQPSGPPIPAPQLGARVTLSLADTPVAAYWLAGQSVDATVTVTSTASAPETLSLDAVTSHYAWAVHLDTASVILDPGATVSVPATIEVLPDAWADIPVRVTVRARDAAGAQATAHAEITPDRTAGPADPHVAWSVPDALLGGLDVAATALGGVPVPSVDPASEARLYDGIEHSSGAFVTATGAEPVTLTTDLAGDSAVPIAGFIIDPLGPVGQTATGPREITLSLSSDGTTFQDVLAAELSPLPLDQSFVLPEPVPARFARLRIDSTWADPGVPVAISEWKVIAQPGVSASSDPLNVADSALGGHVVRADPQFGSQDDAQRMLTIDQSPAQVMYVSKGTSPTWIIGFKDDRAADLTQLAWVDPPVSDSQARLRHVDVAVSTESPLGPWQALGSWILTRGPDGSVAPFAFDTPTWVRFIRFTGPKITLDPARWEVPAELHAVEVPSSPDHLSIVGEWGQGGSWGPFELAQPPALSPLPDVGEPNNTPETATPLSPTTPVTGFVHHNDDVDWYSLSTGAGQDSLTFDVGGSPTLGVRLRLYDATGTEVPMVFGDGAVPGTGAYRATVKPDSSYRVEVDQPVFNAVFAFDSSGSMTPYLPLIEQVKRAYVADRQQDDVPAQIINFAHDRTQTALVEAGTKLEGRDGARAILLITDWELTGYPDTQLMWQTLSTARPLVFGLFVGDITPFEGDDAMHDIAFAGHGTFDYGPWHASGDRAFDRMATWLRRPAQYTISYVASSKPVPPARPATLSVVSPPAADGSPGRPALAKDVAVEIILDTSGSMLTPLGTSRRIDVAKAVLTELVTRDLPTAASVAIRVFGDPAHPCNTTLAVPYGPLDPQAVTNQIDGIQVFQQNDTPVGLALRSVSTDLATTTGTRIVLLITDSQETWPNRDLCGLDPMVAVRELAKSDTHVDVVGLSVSNAKARRTMQTWTRVGHGQYFAANDPGQLAQAVTTAVSAPFDVFDASGTRIGGGIVGAPPVTLAPGTYRVVVRTDPEVTFDAVVLQSGGSVTLTIPASTNTSP